MGVRVDYLAIIFYATDLVWLGWVLNQLRIKNFQANFKKFFTINNLLLAALVVGNILIAENKVVAIYRWLRIGQWFLTVKLVGENKEEIKKYLNWIIPVWIVGESFLGLAQVLNAGSLNGIWWWLGERRFYLGGIGIAEWSVWGEKWIRAYGTFSHPNSLAGFLLLAWWWWRKEFSKKQKIWGWMVNWSAVMGIFLAGSRTVWAVMAGLIVVNQLSSNKKQILGKILLGVGIICLFLGMININYRISEYIGGWDPESWQKRKELFLAAIEMIKANPLLGVGAGNFVVRLPEYWQGKSWWLQPVHNIFLLALSEIGILGIILMVRSRISEIKLKIKKNWWFWIIVVLTGMVDHYWLTLPQNSWLLGIILGLI